MTKIIADYFKTQPVVKAWLFGSFARGEETPESDVDILVQYDDTARISLLTISCSAFMSYFCALVVCMPATISSRAARILFVFMIIIYIMC